MPPKKNFLYSWQFWVLIPILALILKYSEEYENWFLLTIVMVYFFSNLALFGSLSSIIRDKEDEAEERANDLIQWKVYFIVSTVLHIYLYSELQEYSFEILGLSFATFVGLSISNFFFSDKKSKPED